MTNDTISFNIFRFNPASDKEAYFQKYEIPFTRKDLTVLEGLVYIQQHRMILSPFGRPAVPPFVVHAPCISTGNTGLPVILLFPN